MIRPSIGARLVWTSKMERKIAIRRIVCLTTSCSSSSAISTTTPSAAATTTFGSEGGTRSGSRKKTKVQAIRRRKRRASHGLSRKLRAARTSSTQKIQRASKSVWRRIGPWKFRVRRMVGQVADRVADGRSFSGDQTAWRADDPPMRAKEASAAGVQVVDHPLVAARLSILRARATPPNEFRDNIQQLAIILLGEAARAWETRVVEMESPLRWFLGAELARPIVLVPILRAGLGLLDGMIRIVPEASTGHIGIYRDPQTLRPVRYYSRLPPNLSQAQVLLLDPMLATGQSAAEAVSIL